MADISVSATTSPIVPKYTPSQKQADVKANTIDKITKESQDSISLQRIDIQKSNVQIVPPGKEIQQPEFEPSSEIKRRQDVDTIEQDRGVSDQITRKSKEIQDATEELQSVEAQKTYLESKVAQLNNELERLKQNEEGIKLNNAEFRMSYSKDDDEYYVDLVNIDQNTVIKEITTEDMERILDDSQGATRGRLLDLFS